MGTPGGHPHSSGRVLDAGALKALVHPLRYRLLELLIEDGPATATSLGRVVGENSGSTSYHLRQLAEHGLIEEATDVGNNRDRWWRAAGGGWTLEGFDLLERDDTRDDTMQLLDQVQRSRVAAVERWHRDAARWGLGWARATIESTARLRLTREQLTSLTDELMGVVQRYRDEQVSDDHPDSAKVHVHVETFPIEDPPAEPVDD